MNRSLPLTALLLAFAAAPALAVPDASGQVTSAPAADIPADAAMSARLNYNVGFEQYEKAQAAEKAAASLKGSKAKSAHTAVMADYAGARGRFEEAARADPGMKEAWNLVGYTSRRLGDYEASLAAYEKALALDPAYPEAIEYRAEACLALNRLDDVKSAYIALSGAAPAHAQVLLASMREWITERRKTPAGTSKAEVDAFAAWVEERAGLAQRAGGEEDSRIATAFQGWNRSAGR